MVDVLSVKNIPAVREAYRMIRWRFIPIRYAGKVQTFLSPRKLATARTARDARFVAQGYDVGPSIPSDALQKIREVYEPRIAQVVPKMGGHPFTNLFQPDDVDAENPVFRYAFSPEVLDRADSYFGGKLRFDSIQYLYSWPTNGELRESQMWHRDYNDYKLFHCIAYVNDVLTPADGPFGFVGKKDASRIRPSPFIRRISDDKFLQELGDGEVLRFYGKAGEAIVVDPARCYHYGSRCERPRSAIFVTFTTHRPYVDAQPMIRGQEERVLAAARLVRPDLSIEYLEQVIGR